MNEVNVVCCMNATVVSKIVVEREMINAGEEIRFMSLNLQNKSVKIKTFLMKNRNEHEFLRNLAFRDKEFRLDLAVDLFVVFINYLFSIILFVSLIGWFVRIHLLWRSRDGSTDIVAPRWAQTSQDGRVPGIHFWDRER